MNSIQIRVVLVIILLATLSIPAFTEEAKFEVVERAREKYGIHDGYLGLVPFPVPDGKFQYWVRQRFPKTPGDYFTWPIGGDSASLQKSEYSEIQETLGSSVDSAYYDDFILNNLNGYEYTIGEGRRKESVYRREYHIYYALGDTIYVISGWLGKFLSFYRAIPGEFRYDADELNAQVKELSSAYRMTDKSSFKRIDDKGNYLLEYVDRENMMRVRNYLIYGTFILAGSETGESRKYNLIEITKFIDKEVMP